MIISDRWTERVILKFNDFEFGFADATKEFTRTPEIFENAFCDSRNIIEKLLNSYQFLLIGRKGVGKSAFSAKIQSLAKRREDLYAIPMNLNDFEFATFAKNEYRCRCFWHSEI